MMSDGESQRSTPVDNNLPSTAPSPMLFPLGPYRRLTDPCSRVPAISESLLICGDARCALSLLPSESVQTVVTPPPYWSLRDYQVEDQIGRDDTLRSYVCSIVEAFDELRRVLRGTEPYGSMWATPILRATGVTAPPTAKTVRAPWEFDPAHPKG